MQAVGDVKIGGPSVINIGGVDPFADACGTRLITRGENLAWVPLHDEQFVRLVEQGEGKVDDQEVLRLIPNR